MPKALSEADKNSPLYEAACNHIDDLNEVMQNWMRVPDLTDRQRRIAIANALIIFTAHWFAINMGVPKDEFLKVAAENFDNKSGGLNG